MLRIQFRMKYSQRIRRYRYLVVPLGHTRFTRRSVQSVALLGCVFCSAALYPKQASAVERFGATPLSDVGFGSTAKAIARASALAYRAAGSQRHADGTFGAVTWGIAVDPSDPSGNTVVSSELPSALGTSSEAAGVAFLEGDPDQPIIVGSVYNADAQPAAAIWTRNGVGQFVNTTLDDEASASVASAVETHGTGSSLIIVVCGKYRLPNGDWHACIWKNQGLGFQRTDLGTLGGHNSEATALLYVGGDAGVYRIVGSAQRPNGRWIAALMEEEGIFYVIRPLPTPTGSESRAYYIGSANGGVWRIAGDVTTQHGRKRGSIWINQDEIPTAIAVPPPDGFLNSTVRGITINGGDGNDTLAIGTAWNTEADRSGFGALFQGPSFQGPITFDLDSLCPQSITVGAAQTITVGACTAAPGSGLAGQILVTGSTLPQAAAFLPVNREAPSIIGVLIGLAVDPRAPERAEAVWSSDGTPLRVRPRTVGHESQILMDFTSAGITDPGSSRTPTSISIVSRFVPRTPGLDPKAVVRVQVRSNVFAVWVTVGLFECPSGYMDHSIDLKPFDGLGADGGAPLQSRLIVSASGPNAGLFELDKLEIATLRTP